MHRQLDSFSSQTLAGREVSVPESLTRPTLLLFAYRQVHQVEVDTWLRAVEHEDRIGRLEVPVLGKRWLPARPFIDGGMASNMDQATREQTMCVYTDVRSFRSRVLGTNSKRPLAVLVDAEGRVYWHAFGAASPATCAELLLAIDVVVGTARQA